MLPLLVLLAGGCAENGDAVLDMFDEKGGRGSVSGVLGGRALHIRSAISSWRPLGSPHRGATIMLSSEPDLCTVFKQGLQPVATQYLVLTLFDWDGDFARPPADPGEYTVELSNLVTETPKRAWVYYLDVNASCTLVEDIDIPDGTVTLSQIGDSVYAGSAELSTADEDVVATFDTEYCPELVELWAPGFPCVEPE